MSADARIAALERAVATLCQRMGTPFALARSTLAANDDGAAQTVQAQLDPLCVRDAVPLLYNFGVTGSPPVGTDLHVTFIDNDRSKPVAVASGHQAYRLRGLAPGDAALYDSRGAYVWLTPTGLVINTAGLPVTINGDLRVLGSITGGYGGGGQVGLKTHRHGTSGPLAAGTATPTPGL